MKLLVMLVSIISLAACGAIGGKIATSGIPSSKYSPHLITSSDVEAYYSALGRLNKNGEVVKDELGAHFFKKEKKGMVSETTLLKQDAGVLKSILSSSAGLMEPVYLFTSTTKVELDWAATKRQHAFFKKKIGLKLLPLKSTRKFHDALVALVNSRLANMLNRSAFDTSIMSTVLSGEYGLYNPKYYDEFLSPLIGNADYVISFPLTGSYLFDLEAKGVARLGRAIEQAHSGDRGHYGKRGVSTPPPINYRMVANNIKNVKLYSVRFVPTVYYKNLKKGGSYHPYSNCSAHSKKNTLESLQLQADTSAIPYYSAISTVLKNRQKSVIYEGKKSLNQALRSVSKNRQLVNNACKVGLKAMGISGEIKSTKLH